MTEATKLERAMADAARFRSLALARSWAQGTTEPRWIVLGSDERFWVLRPADAAVLERHGFEIVR